MEGSENEGSSQNFVSGGESQPTSDAMRPIQEKDSGLEMRIDITQAGNVLRLAGINEECSSASDDSGIQLKETGLGTESPSNNVCIEPPCGVEPNGAACDQSCACGQDVARTLSGAQLLRHPSNDYLGKSHLYIIAMQATFCVCVCVCASLFVYMISGL